jgi:hypothetical protein
MSSTHRHRLLVFFWQVISVYRVYRIFDEQCPDEIVPDKSTSTTLRNTPLTYKHDSAGSFSITGNQLNRVYVRARDYAKLYWSTCSVLFRPDTVDE